MPLALIASVLTMDGTEAALAATQWWGQVEHKVAERRALVSYLQARLRGEDHAMYDIKVRSIPERSALTISRHLHLDETDQFFADAFTRLRAAGPGLEGIAGVPFLIFYCEVSADSDGPIELCRPVASVAELDASGHLQLRIEPAHEETYIRLAMKNMGLAGDAAGLRRPRAMDHRPAAPPGRRAASTAHR